MRASVYHLRKQNEERLGLAMPSGFRSLGYDDVRAGSCGLASLSHSLDLADQLCARLAYSGCEWTWIAKREHDRSGFMGKHAVQQLWAPCQAPGDEATSDTSVTRLSPFSIDPVTVAVASPEKAEATSMAYRRCEPAARDHVHGGKQDGMLYSKRLR
jgi:hypothetical protein